MAKRIEQARLRCLSQINTFIKLNPQVKFFKDLTPDDIWDMFLKKVYHSSEMRNAKVMRLAPIFCHIAMWEGKYCQLDESSYVIGSLVKIARKFYTLDEFGDFDSSKVVLQNYSLKSFLKKYDYYIGSCDIMGKTIMHLPLYAQDEVKREGRKYSIKIFKTFTGVNNFFKKLNNDQNNHICYINSQMWFTDYSNVGRNTLVVLLRDNWKSTEECHEYDSNTAYDDFGLSVITFFVSNSTYTIEHSNLRWNHQANYGKVNVDEALTRADIEFLTGKKYNDIIRDLIKRNSNGNK